MTGPSAPLLPPLLPRCNTMRQAGFEPTTFGSGGGDGQRPQTLAAVVSGTYVGRALASASQRRPRCYHRCYRAGMSSSNYEAAAGAGAVTSAPDMSSRPGGRASSALGVPLL